MSPQVNILCPDSNPRVEYAFQHIFHNVLGWEFQIHRSLEDFNNSQGLKLNYSQYLCEGVVRILPHEFIYQSGIRQQNIEVSWHEGLPVFFQTDSSCNWGFDIVSMCFYILSRYEEYLDFMPDAYGRFSADKSMAFRYDFLELPVVDYWAIQLGTLIAKKSGMVFKQNNKSYHLLSTIDIDQAWAFAHKSWKNPIGMMHDLWRFQFKAVTKRASTMFDKKNDPFHSFDYIHSIHKKYAVELMYFVLLSDKSKKEDANHPVELPAFKEFLLNLSSTYPVFLHPSLSTFESGKLLVQEKSQLESIIKKPIVKSRQHFLVLNFPHTYRSLIAVGILEDYSMMYHDHVGFRAGTSFPFKWYDLERERTTNLSIHPPCLMDVNMKLHQKLSIEEATKNITELKRHVQNVNGCFQIIWHNSSLGDIYGWKGWKEVYEFIFISD
jgi:hypothetical protein